MSYEKFCENIMCCESVRASASLHKDHLVVLARRFFAHAHSWDINIVLFIHINSMLTHKTHANHANNISTILTADSDHDNHLSCPWPSRTTPQSDKVPETLVCGKTWRGGIVVTTHMGYHTYIGFHTYWPLRVLVIIFSDHHAYWVSFIFIITQRDV